MQAPTLVFDHVNGVVKQLSGSPADQAALAQLAAAAQAQQAQGPSDDDE